MLKQQQVTVQGVEIRGVELLSLMEFMRSVRGSMSQRDMADWLGISQATVNRLLNDPRTPHETTLEKIADATGIPPVTIREMAKRPPGAPHPFRLPAEANQLTESQRDVVRKMISVLLDASGPAKVTR